MNHYKFKSSSLVSHGKISVGRLTSKPLKLPPNIVNPTSPSAFSHTSSTLSRSETLFMSRGFSQC